IAGAIALSIVSGFLFESQACFHWFIIPVFGVGTITTAEMVRWVRSPGTMLRPSGFVGFAAFYSCFLTPLLHVALDRWMAYVVPPDDWRPWLGIMGILNFAGLLLYKGVLYWNSRQPVLRRRRWAIDYDRFRGVVLIAICLSVLVQAWLLTMLGGFQGLLDLFL